MWHWLRRVVAGITPDIPLAAEVVAQGAQGLNPRGALYTDTNVGERLAVRNLFDELLDGGAITGGPANFSSKGKQGVRKSTGSLADGGKKLILQVQDMDWMIMSLLNGFNFLQSIETR